MSCSQLCHFVDCRVLALVQDLALGSATGARLAKREKIMNRDDFDQQDQHWTHAERGTGWRYHTFEAISSFHAMVSSLIRMRVASVDRDGKSNELMSTNQARNGI